MMKSLFCLALSLVVMTQSGANSITYEHLHEKANYHIGELKAIFQEMDKVHAIHKRSATLRTNYEIVESLRSLCASLPPSTKSNRKTEVDSKGDKQTIFPLKFEAKRDNNTLDITLTVQHSSNVFMAIANYREQKKRLLTVPKVSKDNRVFTKTSRETFSFDLSQYSLIDYRHVSFVLYPTSIQKLNNRSSIWPTAISTYSSIIDFQLNEIMRSGQISHTNELSVKLPLGKYRVLNSNDKPIFPQKGVYRTVVEVELQEDIQELHVRVQLYDWKAKTFESETMRVSAEHKNGTFKVDLGSRGHDRQTFLSAEVLKQRTVNETVIAKVAILVNSGKRKMSGLLQMYYNNQWNFTEDVRDTIEVGTIKIFKLKLPYKIKALPPNEVQIHTDREVMCDKRFGNQNDYDVKYGTSCTIRCRAEGTNIASIAITKTSPYIPPVQSNSYVTEYGAFAIYDMGPASESNAGTYRCAVVTKTGKIKTEEIKLMNVPERNESEWGSFGNYTDLY